MGAFMNTPLQRGGKPAHVSYDEWARYNGKAKAPHPPPTEFDKFKAGAAKRHRERKTRPIVE